MSGTEYMEVDKATESRLCGAIFIDQHKDTLIQRASCVEPILDKLLSMEIISDEEYQNIKSEKTSQKQMRALLMEPMRSRGDRAKQILYNILKEQQKFMMIDLGVSFSE
ncbi:apoptosis-associated speck-like protein containing a CARD [Tachysurus fulvidraco]|uniref:apoptosis-associated speck-like protein containing a CARD n=1 Tax=Tachysurus fulvidraco TaxID=1234273 RepID=UPI001FEF0B1E|nr:apoptosis-associated speck-like protein containing a CARD [Tachysurus fulvidraco]